ncbi:hypothetical protein DFH27DRAFT_521388 [Peziza echinospora]|nr:hypothetical protein DFH27DRAFT_521388 [Peziza echinospora]
MRPAHARRQSLGARLLLELSATDRAAGACQRMHLECEAVSLSRSPMGCLAQQYTAAINIPLGPFSPILGQTSYSAFVNLFGYPFLSLPPPPECKLPLLVSYGGAVFIQIFSNVHALYTPDRFYSQVPRS